MLREKIRKQRASQQTRKRRASQHTRKRTRREIPPAIKASKKGKRRKTSKKKRSRRANLRWLTACFCRSIGKGRSSQEMLSIAKDVCARLCFWQEEMICFL